MAFPAALGPISGGQGGIDLSGGPSTAESGAGGSAGGQAFYFAQPESVQVANAISWPLVIGAGVVALWLLKRR